MAHKYRFSDAELAALSGEVLPDRLLLSVMSPAATESNTQVHYACQTTRYEGTPGLLGTGLFAQQASTTVTCVPGVVEID
ncbi:hypothetical protein [Actinomadura flavalba]|uniref:hypothetical protein n=1 Tax=Actinomadura flavalba TaxID=1120938 RepID=UPI00036FF7BE|nr:hypothetical protein [Actinomadura flavalba]